MDRIGIGNFSESFDRANKIRDTVKDATAQLFVSKLGEPAFDQVEPGGAGGNEVQLEAWMLCQPLLHVCVFVRAIVIENHMQIQIERKLSVQAPQELQELLMAMASKAVGDHLALEDVQSSEQTGGAVPFVIMNHSAATS